MDETAAPRFRTHLAGAAPPWEVAVVAVVAIAVWRFTLGWNWSSIATSDPVRMVAPQSDLDWLVLALAVAVAVGWLAWRGWPVVGALAIWAPIIVLSGWRLAAAGVLGWPISLASLIFVLSALCIVAGGAGAWVRHRSTSPDSDVDHDDDYDGYDVDTDDAVPLEAVPAEPITY